VSHDLPSSPAVARNREAILAVLEGAFSNAGKVLEIGSGTGEHAVFFAPRLPWLTWQTSDCADYLPGIRAWVERVPAANLRGPFELDVNDPPPLDAGYDAVFSANTAHIMSFDEVRQCFGLVAALLPPGGRFCLYGPFNRSGRFTSESNERFDASLKARDPAMGIRDIEALDGLAAEGGMARVAMHEMPANNFIAVWQKR
jgi:cyclopropane fatty-acyl-phospholipid synthase-like methyltransferase